MGIVAIDTKEHNTRNTRKCIYCGKELFEDMTAICMECRRAKRIEFIDKHFK